MVGRGLLVRVALAARVHESSHDGWSGERDVIDDGVQVLDELAYWFFTGEPIAKGVGDSDI
jgi:hypothetical protein